MKSIELRKMSYWAYYCFIHRAKYKFGEPLYLVRILNPWTNFISHRKSHKFVSNKTRNTPKTKNKMYNASTISPRRKHDDEFSAGIQSPSRYFITLKRKWGVGIKHTQCLVSMCCCWCCCCFCILLTTKQCSLYPYFYMVLLDDADNLRKINKYIL